MTIKVYKQQPEGGIITDALMWQNVIGVGVGWGSITTVRVDGVEKTFDVDEEFYTNLIVEWTNSSGKLFTKDFEFNSRAWKQEFITLLLKEIH